MKRASVASLVLLAALPLLACNFGSLPQSPAGQPAQPAAPQHIVLPLVFGSSGGGEPAPTQQVFLPEVGVGGLPGSAWQLVPQQTDASRPEQNFSLQIIAPYIQGTPEGQFAPFNQAVQAFVDGEVAAYQDIFAQAALPETGGMAQIGYLVASAPGGLPIQPGHIFAESPAPLNPDQAIFPGGHDILAIYFEVAFYTGGAHPGLVHAVLNYDLTANRPLALADLFRPGVDALQTVAGYCINDLRQRQDLLFPDYATNGAAPRPENYRLWSLTPLGLLITFDEYQVAPYAAGPQTVLIPYQALETALDPLGPLGLLAK
jgi:hypothetical protein